MASLADIVASIKDTNDLLTDNVKAQQRVFDIMDDAARKDKEARMDALQSTKKTKAVRGGGGFGASFKEGLGMGTAFGAASSLIGGLLGKLAIPLLAAAAYAFDQINFDGAGLKSIKEWGKNLITGIIDKLDFLNIFSDKEQTDIATSIIKAAGPALLVGLFSKKAGLAVFIGGLFANYVFDKVFTDDQKKEMEGSFNEGVKSMLGIDVTNAFLFKVGVGLAGLFGLPLILGAMSFALTGVAGLFSGTGKGGTKKMKLLPRLLKNFRRGFLGKFGAGLALFSMGEMIGDATEKATGDAVSADAVQNIMNAAIIGSFFGWKGLLIAAIGAIAIEGFKYLIGKARENRAQIKSQLEADIGLAQAEVGMAMDTGDDAEIKAAKRRLRQAKIKLREEAYRTSQLTNAENEFSLAERMSLIGTGFRNGKADFLAEGYSKVDAEGNVVNIPIYTGQLGQANLNPYERNSPEYEKFRAAAEAAVGARFNATKDTRQWVNPQNNPKQGNEVILPISMQTSQSGNTTAVTILSDNGSFYTIDTGLNLGQA